MSEEDARARILCEATRLFGEKGFGSTSIRDVAAAAGVTNPAIYYHFGSKEGLYVETFQRNSQAMVAMTEAVVAGPGSVRDRLEAWLQGHIEATRANPAAARLMMHANNRPHAGEPLIDLMSIHLRASAALVRLLREGVASGELRADLDVEVALAAMSGVLIVAIHAILSGMDLPPDTARRLVGFILRGAAP